MLARSRSMNRAGIPHQKFVTKFADQLAEPTIVPRGSTPMRTALPANDR
jgi:hypothetical protein